MKNIFSYPQYVARYEKWFETNQIAYQSELSAIKALLPKQGKGIEIGVGTGKFASPLGIYAGIEPSKQMSTIAKKQGINVINAFAEDLPLKNRSFDFVLMVTTVCFLNNIEIAFQEAHRILKKSGYLIIGMVDNNSKIGQIYLKKQNKSTFYKDAHFYTTDKMVELMKQANFKHFSFRQTLFQETSKIKKVEKPISGFGKGSFVVIRGKKK